ncbi:hypothetical protein ASPVEDRAFT_419885 [Aspergillus versicolor CBS 583.65]|uniref:Uncharacterized protein n=1 Tax=Aspergillus versicolor CBS 583.65 TaxID=1036611 RepID=A0A1L9Q571_ASPVE|nr:uncharacterized protein ASPVEDRAFT_419885 [Aspergillus versicolor CBS 583.65]OJJ08925.1 hypothetical protein ASPVEDRAFT_419885 [Aspergillus versicolor CBS 583.65]
MAEVTGTSEVKSSEVAALLCCVSLLTILSLILSSLSHFLVFSYSFCPSFRLFAYLRLMQHQSSYMS